MTSTTHVYYKEKMHSNGTSQEDPSQSHIMTLSIPCVCLYRCVPTIVVTKAADPSSAAALCSDVAGGSAETRS